MSLNITAGQYKFVSLIEGEPPTSIAEPYHPGVPFQSLRLGLPVDTWVLETEEGGSRFTLGGYPYIGIKDDKVIFSIDPKDRREWIFDSAPEKSFIVKPKGQEDHAWTVVDEDSPNPSIEVQPLGCAILKSQMFKFVPADE